MQNNGKQDKEKREMPGHAGQPRRQEEIDLPVRGDKKADSQRPYEQGQRPHHERDESARTERGEQHSSGPHRSPSERTTR